MKMRNSQAVLSVRFNSSLDESTLLDVCNQDLDAFRKVPGLIQKYYIMDDEAGAISGFYIFKSKNARDSFWNSELAKSIPVRYHVIPETIRVELYEMAIVLNEAVLAGQAF